MSPPGESGSRSRDSGCAGTRRAMMSADNELSYPDIGLSRADIVTASGDDEFRGSGGGVAPRNGAPPPRDADPRQLNGAPPPRDAEPRQRNCAPPRRDADPRQRNGAPPPR